MFASAKGELEHLQAAKTNLEEKLIEVSAKIDAMTQTVNALAPLVGETGIPSIKDPFLPPLGAGILKASGITIAVRTLLDSKAGEDFSAPVIRDQLQEHGDWDWAKYTNPLSAIHTVLKRLVESGAVKEVLPPTPGGRKFYSALRPPPPGTIQIPESMGRYRSPREYYGGEVQK